MSPDDVFAAQMWPWPDPVIKRDNAGRVLFINAAFLSLYGGRVETWTGQPVMGWPAPNPQGHPYRFETRAGVAPQEIVYDWVEVMMADGNALAIARDVTAYQPPAQTQPVPVMDTAPVTPPASTIDSAPAAPHAAYSQAEEPAPAPAPEMPAAAPAVIAEPARAETPPPPAATDFHGVPAEAEKVKPADIQPHTQVVPAQVAAPEPASEPEPVPQPAPEPALMTREPVAPAAQADVEMPEPSPQLMPTEPEAPAAQAESPQTTSPPVRDFERRALPIENEDAVLGSNWRDAVIARAVGSAVAPAETEAPEPAVPEMPAPSTGAKPLKILLAEDNAINALLTRTLLEADGCVVETVEDGALAVDAVKNNTYDLILMDMHAAMAG